MAGFTLTGARVRPDGGGVELEGFAADATIELDVSAFGEPARATLSSLRGEQSFRAPTLELSHLSGEGTITIAPAGAGLGATHQDDDAMPARQLGGEDDLVVLPAPQEPAAEVALRADDRLDPRLLDHAS